MNFLCLVVEGRGLKEGEVGKNFDFIIMINDFDGKQCYFEIDQIIVKVQILFGEDLENKVKDYGNGKCSVIFILNCYGYYEVMILVND